MHKYLIMILFAVGAIVPAMSQKMCSNQVVDGYGKGVVDGSGNPVVFGGGTCATDGAGTDAMAWERIYIYKFEPYEPYEADMRRALKNATENVYFDFDQAKIKPEGYTVLDDIATAMKKNDKYTLVIEGHSDKTGTKPYNYELGKDRAKSVYNYLTDKGVSASKMKIRSYGETETVSTDPKYNRRVEFFVIK